MDIETLLFRMGIPTYEYSVDTLLSGKIKEYIGTDLQETVGYIYGMSINIEGTTSSNATVNNILSVDAPKLFLNLKYGQSIFVTSMRLDHLVYSDPSAAPKYSNSRKYLPCNIPLGTDLKLSYYDNPSLLSAKNVTLNFFYIDKTGYSHLLKNGTVKVS